MFTSDGMVFALFPPSAMSCTHSGSSEKEDCRIRCECKPSEECDMDVPTSVKGVVCTPQDITSDSPRTCSPDSLTSSLFSASTEFQCEPSDIL